MGAVRGAAGRATYDARTASRDAATDGGGDLGAHNTLYVASTFGHLRSFHIPYIQAMLDAGDRVTLVGAGDSSDLPAQARIVPVEFVKRMSAPGNFAAAARIASMLRTGDFDLVLTHTSLAAFFTRLAVAMSGKRRTVRVVNTVHGYLFGLHRPVGAAACARRRLLLDAERMCARSTDLIVTMNEEDTAIARRWKLSAGPVVQVDGMGVPACAHPHLVSASERSSARAALGLSADAFVMLYAAEFSARKDQRTLIQGMAHLPERAVLVLPGAGEQLQQCRELAAELGLANRALFPGFVQDMQLWRHAADVCVSASRSEGLPFHVAEALASGLPCVLSSVKGHVDMVRPNQEGLLFPAGDFAAFARAAGDLMADPDVCARMGRQAVQRAARYAPGAVMPTLMRLYRMAKTTVSASSGASSLSN